VGGSLSKGCALLALLVAAAGCGGATTTHAVGGSVAACPSDPPGAPRLRVSQALDGLLVPPDPLSAQICAFAPILPAEPVARQPLRVALGQATARTLALLLDEATPLRSGPPSCVPASLNDVIALKYRSGTVTVAVQDCDAPAAVAVSAGGRSWVVSDAAAEAIEGATLTFGAGHRATPSFVGLPFVAAARRALAFAPDFAGVTGEVRDVDAPFGSVVWQEPLPGVGQSKAADEVDLLVAVGPALPCRPSQLAGRYRRGGVGGGSSFASIVLFDTSSLPCSLSGGVTLTGLDAHGRPATVAASGPLEPPVTLSPRATPRAVAAHPVAALAAAFGFSAQVRDDPGAPAGLCYGHETYVAAWSVRLAGQAALRVANGGPRSGGRFFTCHRRLDFGGATLFQLIQ
jgi:hypothetical protein